MLVWFRATKVGILQRYVCLSLGGCPYDYNTKIFYKISALSHYHASKSIKSKDAVDGKVDEHKENSFVFDESSLNGDVCPNVLRMAHVKESLACHEEAQRLQRMCRDLKVHRTADSRLDD